MKQTLKDLSKLNEKSVKKLSVLGFVLLSIPGIPVLYWIGYLFFTPYKQIIEFAKSLF